MVGLHTLLVICLCASITLSSEVDADKSASNKSDVEVSEAPKVNWICPNGWVSLIDDSSIMCLWFSNGSLSHPLARDHCAKYQASLVKVNTVKKIQLLKELIAKREAEHWIGLHKDRGYESSFRWYTLRGDVRADTSILPAAFRDYMSYKAQCVYVSSDGAEWEMEDCDTEWSFICEKNIECSPGSFGDKCVKVCHCIGEPCTTKSSDGSDDVTCRWGCQRGWMGPACDIEKQDPDVKYYCLNSDQGGKKVLIRIYTKGVEYKSIHGLTANQTRGQWCQGSNFFKPYDPSKPVEITIRVDEAMEEEAERGDCVGDIDDPDSFQLTLVIQENEGILLEHDLQVSIQCNFTKGENLIRDSQYVINGEPSHVHHQSLEPQSIADDVVLQIVNGYSGEPVIEASVGSTVVLQIKYGLMEGSLLKGVFPYNCSAVSPSGKVKKQLIDQNGCSLSSSPVSTFSKATDNTIKTGWFPLFAFEGEQSVQFQCSFSLCFHENCFVGCQGHYESRHRRDAVSDDKPQEHSATRTIRVLPSIDTQRATKPNSKPGASVDSSSYEYQPPQPAPRSGDGHQMNYLMYVNPVTCSLFLLLLVVFLIMYVSFLHTLRRSVDSIRKEIEGTRSRDKFLNCGCRKPLKDKDYVCP
ncbi:unnamed protein product [Lymnaea stagnalis]|uniref:ZP domain-containing protein n=1 Tax=Lymnaea stagnalis TaxID=6523 RepID=A0AAV2HWL6_LYMST